MNGFYISTDKAKLDLEPIHRFLSSDSYWAQGRSIEVVRKSIENSLCFGVFRDGEQVGFARVVTDYAVFAWILDVFILSTYRKKGLGKLLVESIMMHAELQKLQRWGLATEDAHGLYDQYGFRIVGKPNTFMEIVALPR
jgi:GNAT superfamily N-acetyltransferase